MTGTIYLTAMRLASIATQKQSAGVDAASTGIGASELRPKSACNRSACSVLVGKPVDGPPRWMSQMTSGISTATASPIASVLSAMPGPEVVVCGDFVQNVGCRSDRVTTLKKCQPSFLRCGNKPQSERLIPAHASIESWGELRRRNLVADRKSFRRFAVRIAALQRELVRFHEQRLVLELVRNPANGRLARAVVKPVAH